MAPHTTPPGRESDIISTLNMANKSPSGKWLKVSIWSIVILLITALAFGFWQMRDNSGAIRYKTRPAVIGDITVTVGATGNLQPTNQVDVGSELSGIVKSVEVDYNDQVTIGQVLARLDTSRLTAQILQSEAALEAAHARVLQTEATIKETRAALQRLHEVGRLSDNKAVSRSDLDSAQAALNRATADHIGARAAVSQAEATLQLNRTDLAKTEIRSPINGIVLVRSVEPGQTVAASLQAPVLFTLAENLTQMDLRVDVDEADVGQVQAGQAAKFTVDAYADRSYPAEISQVRFGAKNTSGVITYETILKVDNSDLSLRPGMTAAAAITITEVTSALLVPNAALRFSPKAMDKSKETASILSKIMPRRPTRRPGRQRETAGTIGQLQQVWTLVNNQPVAVSVTVGLTDGTASQIVAGDLEAGMELVIDTESAAK
jgi:HlyD family secretion protein